MTMDEFNAFHMPALERNAARHNLLLGLMPQPLSDVRRWTLGGPGACAILTAPNRAVILGDLSEHQCQALAEKVCGTVFGGVLGPDDTAHWLAVRARQLGVEFGEPVPQMIHALETLPVFPGASGAARPVTADDLDLFTEWKLAFHDEALPDDPKPSREEFPAQIAQGRLLFWQVDDTPVSVASVARESRNGACIGFVYSPPALRGRGYAGSVTAAIVDRIFAMGKTMACLYTDLRNPYSNRCYAKIGFRPVCASWHYTLA